MSGNDNIAVIGYSGHAYVVLDACSMGTIKVLYYCDNEEKKANPFGLSYAGNEQSGDFDWQLIDKFVLGIGDNQLRYKIASSLENRGKSVLNVLHPQSYYSSRAVMGAGNYIGPNACVNAMAKMGDYCIVNTGSVIEHECVLGDAVHIAPGAVLAGNVSVGKLSFIGANAVVKQGVRIGSNVIVGAGAVVIKDIPDNGIWAGNPAKYLK